MALCKWAHGIMQMSSCHFPVNDRYLGPDWQYHRPSIPYLPDEARDWNIHHLNLRMWFPAMCIAWMLSILWLKVYQSRRTEERLPNVSIPTNKTRHQFSASEVVWCERRKTLPWKTPSPIIGRLGVYLSSKLKFIYSYWRISVSQTIIA